MRKWVLAASLVDNPLPCTNFEQEDLFMTSCYSS